jgi:hypothetical protein
MITVRSRKLALRSSTSREGYRSIVSPHANWEITTPYQLSGTQVTESEGHPFPKKGSDEDLGGEFFTRKTSYKDNCRRVKCVRNFGSDQYYYEGTVYPYTSGSTGYDLYPAFAARVTRSWMTLVQ